MRATLPAILLIAAACSGAPTPTPLQSPTAGAPSEVAATMSPSASVQLADRVTLGEVAIGECFNELKDALDDRIHGVHVVPCEGPHQMEMYGHLTLPYAIGSPYPGDEAMDQVGDETCRQRFKGYVGVAYDASVYFFWSYTPDEIDWSFERSVDCAVGNEQRSMQPPGVARDSHK